MRENVLDVLMYLFETYIEAQDETEIDPAADAGIVTPDQGEEEY